MNSKTRSVVKYISFDFKKMYDSMADVHMSIHVGCGVVLNLKIPLLQPGVRILYNSFQSANHGLVGGRFGRAAVPATG